MEVGDDRGIIRLGRSATRHQPPGNEGGGNSPHPESLGRNRRIPPYSPLTNLDVSDHRGVDAAVIFDIARGVEGNKELRAHATQAGVKGRVVVRGDAVL